MKGMVFCASSSSMVLAACQRSMPNSAARRPARSGASPTVPSVAVPSVLPEAGSPAWEAALPPAVGCGVGFTVRRPFPRCRRPRRKQRTRVGHVKAVRPRPPTSPSFPGRAPSPSFPRAGGGRKENPGPRPKGKPWKEAVCVLHGVIMAGGRGERFWPYGLRRRPKQFLDLFGGGSLLQHTARRIEPLVPWERMWVVTTADYADAVRAQLPSLPSDHVLVEPEGKNTAPCLALALAHLRYRVGLDGGTVMAVLPADHWIRDEEGFRALLADAGAVARDRRELVTLGIEPTGPETGYGYIQVGPELGRAPGGHPFRRVERFVEKPSRERAEAMLAQGGYLWNSGMFIWRLDALEEAFR